MVRVGSASAAMPRQRSAVRLASRGVVALVAAAGLWSSAGCRFDVGGLAGIQSDAVRGSLDSGAAPRWPDFRLDSARPDAEVADSVAFDAPADVVAVDAAADALPTDGVAPDRGVDGGGLDAGLDTGPDSGSSTDSSLDSAPADGRPAVDAADSDALPIDSTAADARGGDQGAPSCRAKYGSAKGYHLCREDPQGCRFYAETDGTCRQLCSKLGGSCLHAYDNVILTQCVPFLLSDCDRSLNDQICVCSR